MSELEIKSLQDLDKLNDWHIKKAWYEKDRGTLRLLITHIAAAKPVLFSISIHINHQINGLAVITTPNMRLETVDIEEEKSHEL